MTEPISKVDISVRQLLTAIDLYFRNGDLVSVVTLAGASEEILGKLVRAAGQSASLDDVVERLCGMYEAAFGGAANPKAFVELRTRARNEFKQIASAVDFNGDLEREASSIIKRAIENHRKLGLSYVDEFRRFEAEMLRRWRDKQEVV